LWLLADPGLAINHINSRQLPLLSLLPSLTLAVVGVVPGVVLAAVPALSVAIVMRRLPSRVVVAVARSVLAVRAVAGAAAGATVLLAVVISTATMALAVGECSSMDKQRSESGWGPNGAGETAGELGWFDPHL